MNGEYARFAVNWLGGAGDGGACPFYSGFVRRVGAMRL